MAYYGSHGIEGKEELKFAAPPRSNYIFMSKNPLSEEVDERKYARSRFSVSKSKHTKNQTSSNHYKYKKCFQHGPVTSGKLYLTYFR